MDVRMPDGTIITGVPEGITQTELLARYSKYSPAPVERKPAGPQPTMDSMGNVIGTGMAEPEYKERTIFSDIGDVGKQIAAPIAAAPFQIPKGVELGIKGLARRSMEGEPEAVMPSSVFQPGLDTEETLFGQETPEQSARRKLQAQRAVAGLPSIPGADMLSGIGKDVRSSIQGSLSEEGKKALKESEITGNIFKGEVDFGKDPSVRGYALQIANVLGSMAVPIATTLITKSPAAGGAAGGAMAADEAGQNAAEYISKIPHAELLKNSPFYAELIAGGALPKEARQLTIEKAAQSGAALQGLVATVGGTVTGKLVTGAFDDIIKKLAGSTKVGRATGAGLLSGLEESMQETGEGIGSDIGIRSVINNKELGEDSAANAVLGFLGGAAPGGIRGLLVEGEAPKAQTKTAEDLAREKGFLVSMPKREAGQQPARVPTLEEQVQELLATANTPTPEEPVTEAPASAAPAATPAPTVAAASVAEEDQESIDRAAMLQELEETTGAKEPEVQQVAPPAAEPTEVVEAAEAPAAQPTVQEPAAASKVKEGEPPVPPGMTRMYHGSATADRVDGPAWFSTDRNYAQNYRPGAQLQYVDYPTEKVNAALDPDGYGQTVDKGFTWNTELDSKETGPRKILGAPATASAPAKKLASNAKPTTEDGNFGEMSLKDFQAKHPKPYNVKDAILQTDISKMSDQDVLDRYGKDELVTLAKLLGANASGTKQVLLSNIRKEQANREQMKSMTPEKIQAMSTNELRNLVAQLGGNPAYKGRDALIKFATEWRDSSLSRTQEMVAESNHVKYVVQSVKKGNQNISDENIKRYEPELWQAVDPDTQKELYAKLLRKRAASMFVPPYMSIPTTVVSLRDQADRSNNDKEAQKLVDLANALQALYDKQQTKPNQTTEAKTEPDDLESMFDDVLAEEMGAQKPSKTESGTEGRTTTQAAKSAAKNTAEGFANAIEGLGKLFGQGPNDDGTTNLNSGIPVKINEETYKKAKPLFQAAVSNFQQAGADIREVMRAVIRAVLDRFGKEATENMKPYIVRFVSEYQSEQEEPAADVNQAIIEGVRDHLLNGGSFSTIVEARKFIEGITGNKIEPGTQQAKEADEMIEAGVVMSARQIIADGREDGLQARTIYEQLVDLYDRQPSLNVRSSTSVANQAYSTPAPLAFVASELAGITNKTTVYEPTGGNGMLLIGANPKLVTANELNEDRFNTLKRLFPEATVTQGNALDGGPTETVDVVIENPPFGKVGDISNIDHEIAMESLLSMDDEGRAVLILGGVQSTTDEGRRDGYRGNAKRNFYFELYDKYNVVDHFTVGGNMYSKQGTTYPVDVIVIDGIGKSKRDLPAADLPQLITSYEQLKEKLNDRLVSGQDSSTSGTDGGVSTSGEGGSENVDLSTRRPGNETGTAGAGPTGSGGPSVQGDGTSTGGQREPAGGRTGNAQPGTEDATKRGPAGGSVASTSETTKGNKRANEGRGPAALGGVSVVSGERVGSGLNDRAGQEQETEGQVSYAPFSNANSVGTLVPRAMAESINDALAALEAAVGSIDDYVATSLEMDLEDVRILFSAEQVDALALSIRNAEAGKGFIIGDQTGVGKGRVVAAMIRYALVNGKVPIFVTEKPNLYSDMIRDLDDIGMTDELGLDTAKPKILITNNDEKIPYTLLRKVNGEIVKNNLTLTAPEKDDELNNLFKGMQESESLGEYKVIFTTYNQLQTVKGGEDTDRRRLIKQFGAGNYMIFDESHNAGGAGETQARTKEQRENAKEGKSMATGRAGFVRELVQNAFGTFFSSATYAKKPEVMDLYSSTDMKLAVDNLSDLADAIKNGGIPMQQTVANMLAKAGQYIRRERTFAGVSYDTVETKVDKQTAENMATSMRMILDFSRSKEVVVKDIQKELDKQGKKISGGPSERTQVASANFGSIMHNLIDQMLLSLKVQSSIDHAIERLKAGEKVVMTVSNTMGSFLEDYADEMGLSNGDQIDLSFKDMYLRYLEKQRIIKIKPPGKKSVATEYRLTDADLGNERLKQYNEIKAFIESAGFGSAPISPIDYLHSELAKFKVKDLDGNERNVRTEEITGRTSTVNYSTGKPLLASRNSSIEKRVQSVENFNNGTADVIILNQAGSTGLSLHASSKFEDKRKRHMIIIQPEKNIDTHMQMLGRVHRTGQVEPPAYSQMMADIPAEMRPAAVLLKKMASLNANTTGSRKSAVSAEGAVDFINDYGGQVVHEYLRDNPEVYQALGGEKVLKISDDPSEAGEDDIRKVTGYIPILPIKQQEEIYKDLVERYKDLIEREDSMGSNKLEARAFDLDAKTIESKQITKDKQNESNSTSVFAKPAMMERVDVKRTFKPYSKNEVLEQVEEKLKGKSAYDFGIEMLRGLKDRSTEFGRAQVAAMEAAETPDLVKIENFKSQLQTQYNHASTIVKTFPIGTPVSIKNSSGVYISGVVTNLESKGKTKNPVAGSDMKMTLALANGENKSTTLSFSQIGRAYTLLQEDEVFYVDPETLKGGRVPLIDLFDKNAIVRREKRWMVTGNILAGYAAVINMGQIMTYTKDDGTTAQGILMPRTFDFEKQQKNAPVKLKSVDQVMAFFQKFGPKSVVGTNGAVFRISYRGGNQYEFTTPGSKREGGTFFLDKDLIKFTGEFYGSGSQPKKATVYSKDSVEKAIQYLLRDRRETLIALTDKEEARKAFQVPLANVEPSNIERLNPLENQIEDREELIRKYQGLRQKRAAILSKFSKGEAGLSEQAAVVAINELAGELKQTIDATKEDRRSAKNFFADATKSWDQGVISDDVYSAIKTMYEKFPFVLEGLKLSVQTPKTDGLAGQFDPLRRIVRLYKGTNGVEDPATIRHEIAHALEQMMSKEAAKAVVEDWRKKLATAIKNDREPRAQVFFRSVLEFFENPTQESYAYMISELPSYKYYQFVNPSEYWAVNAEKLMARKLGTGWDRFVLAVKGLYEGLKYMVGFNNQYVIHRTFDDIMNARAGRMTSKVLADYVTNVSISLNNQNIRRNYKGGPAPLAEWTSANESKIDNAIYRMQDKHIDTKRVVQAITEEIGDIADRWDPYLQEELYHGRTAKQTSDFLADELQPLLKDMAKRGVALQDFEEYLHNRHAQAYNEMVASRNPEMPDAGSGLSTQEATDYLAKLTPEQKKNFEALAAEIDKIVRGTQDLLVSGGIEKAETIAAWNDKLPFYVPLQRDPDELDFASTGSGLGSGFSTRGKFSKTATGSLKTVVDIFGNIALQRERAIIRSEKARVGRALYGLAITSPNPDFWMPVNPDAIKNKKKLVQELKNMGMRADDAENIIQEPKTAQIDSKTGMVKYQVNPAMRNAPNVFAVRINGEDRFIFFNPGDPRAKRMVESLKNLDAHQLNEMLNGVAEATRAFAAMNTQYNPVFGAWNFARDVMGAAVNLSSTPIAHRKLAVMAGVNPITGAPALRAIYRDLRGKGQKNPKMQDWADLFDRFQKAGGQTGYREQFSRSKERATIIQRELGKLDRSNVRKVVDIIFQWLSDYNDAMENAVRLSAFKVALEEGMSEERAASLAKNLTVNFNRKGQQTSNVNALYAFFNASVQGTARMADTLVDRTPKGKYKLSKTGKKIIVGGLMIGVVQSALLAMAGFDEDEPPDFLKDKNLILPDIFTGSGKYLIVPMPLGLNVFPNIGRIMTEFMFSEKKDVGKLGLRVLGVTMDAFNPLGTSGLAQSIVPTIADPLVNVLSTNKDAFGRPISREDRATNPTPGYERNRETSSAFSQGLSYAINYMTGGGKYGIGEVSPTADQLDYLIGQYAGGVGREGAKIVSWSAAKIKGEETPPYKVPIVGKAYGETETAAAVTDKFYKNVTALAKHEGTIKRMQADRASTTEYRRENPEARLISTANNLENQVTKLNKTKKELLAKEQTDSVKAQIKRIDEQKVRMMTNFNERVKAAQQ